MLPTTHCSSPLHCVVLSRKKWCHHRHPPWSGDRCPEHPIACLCHPPIGASRCSSRSSATPSTTMSSRHCLPAASVLAPDGQRGPIVDSHHAHRRASGHRPQAGGGGALARPGLPSRSRSSAIGKHTLSTLMPVSDGSPKGTSPSVSTDIG
jgi:hypothetical protein